MVGSWDNVKVRDNVWSPFTRAFRMVAMIVSGKNRVCYFDDDITYLHH